MGAAKQMLLEEAEEERHQEFLEWCRANGRRPTDAAYQDFELDEAFEHAMSKDD
jgi:hypothetical protein